MLGIEGKVVAITGASSGIGEATALLLAERGAKVVLGDDSPAGSLYGESLANSAGGVPVKALCRARLHSPLTSTLM